MPSPGDSRWHDERPEAGIDRGHAAAVYAVVFAGGTGARMHTSSTPKQFLRIHGQTILQHTLRHFLSHPQIDGVVVACLEPWMRVVVDDMHREVSAGRLWVVPGGETGQRSIYNGLAELSGRGASAGDIVLVHDAVRPLIGHEIISANIESVRAHGSAVTVAPECETVVTVGADGIIDTVMERPTTKIAKAPQSFRFGDLWGAHGRAAAEGRSDFVDSASLMKAAGHDLHPVEGSADNIKVTTATDFYILRAILDAKEAQQVFGMHLTDGDASERVGRRGANDRHG